MKKIVLFVCWFCWLMNSAQAAQPLKTEVRAVWLATVHGLDWPHRTATSETTREIQQRLLCEMLDKLQEANFNTVFFQTRLRGDVAYPSAIEPYSRIFTGKEGGSPGYDPLAFAIEECHKRGMECHAWFVTFPLGTEEHVREMGKRSVVKRMPKLCKKHQGEWYLDPGVPETADYILSLVREIVENYDIDGIHFDYIRYPEAAKSFPDKATYQRYGKKTKLDDWRRSNINKIVARIYDTVKAKKPWVQVSSSPLGKYSRIPKVPNAGWTAYESVYQDPAQWLREGKQDMIVPMMYYLHKNFFPFVDNWVEQSNGRLIVPGLGAYRLLKAEADWSLNDVTDQIDYTTHFGGAGCAYFRAGNILANEKGIYDELKKDYYQYPAQLPPLTWLNDAVPQAPQEVHVERIGDELKLTWEKPAGETQDLTYTLYCAMGSDTLDLNLPQHILSTQCHTTELYLSVPSDKELAYTFVVTASTRYHIESLPSHETYYYLSKFEK